MAKLIENEMKRTEEMIKYEKETGRYAIWRGIITEGFKSWQKGAKVYNRNKERISLYVSEDMKEKWQNYINNSTYKTISKLIRDSVDRYIKDFSREKSRLMLNHNTLPSISYILKEPLTLIKGYSQLLLENNSIILNDEVKSTIKNIFEQSLLLETKIREVLDKDDLNNSQYDVLLIEDNISTIKLLTSFFKNKGYTCKGCTSATEGLTYLSNSIPKIILLNIILPDISGYEFCKKVKLDLRLKNVPIYFITAINGSEIEEHIRVTGANGFILKPFDFSDFQVILEKLVQI